MMLMANLVLMPTVNLTLMLPVNLMLLAGRVLITL